MSSPQDIVWNTITDSAKTRFDYAAYALALSEFDDGTMAENILFMTIVGLAEERPIDAIVSEVSNQLLVLGLGLDGDDLRDFVKERLNDLPLEIKATSQALTFFDMGIKPPGVLVQIRSILRG